MVLFLKEPVEESSGDRELKIEKNNCLLKDRKSQRFRGMRLWTLTQN